MMLQTEGIVIYEGLNFKADTRGLLVKPSTFIL